jgi:CheY-like chemotaxis protein
MARILVIEDDPSMQALLRDVLLDVGHVVFVANDGREGVSRYRRHHPDLVITDIFMPERNGLDVVLDLASSNANVIAISGGGDLDRADHLDDAIQFGARRTLRKPFTVDALLTAVNETLADHRSPHDGANVRGHG